MKTAELLPSVFYVVCLSACTWDLLDLVQKTHKPEVEGSSPSLDTTKIMNNPFNNIHYELCYVSERCTFFFNQASLFYYNIHDMRPLTYILKAESYPKLNSDIMRKK